MKKKIVRLTESDIEKLVKKIIKEDEMSASQEIDELRKNIGDDNLLRLYKLGVKVSRNGGKGDDSSKPKPKYDAQEKDMQKVMTGGNLYSDKD